MEEQINEIVMSKYDDSEKEDEESSTTGPTVQEFSKHEQTTGKDTDEDASFSDGEPSSLRSSKSDKQRRSLRTTDDTLSISLTSTNEIQDSDKNLSRSTESLNNINEFESELSSIDSEEKQSRTIHFREVKFLQYYLIV